MTYNSSEFIIIISDYLAINWMEIVLPPKSGVELDCQFQYQFRLQVQLELEAYDGPFGNIWKWLVSIGSGNNLNYR